MAYPVIGIPLFERVDEGDRARYVQQRSDNNKIEDFKEISDFELSQGQSVEVPRETAWIGGELTYGYLLGPTLAIVSHSQDEIVASVRDYIEHNKDTISRQSPLFGLSAAHFCHQELEMDFALAATKKTAVVSPNVARSWLLGADLDDFVKEACLTYLSSRGQIPDESYDEADSLGGVIVLQTENLRKMHTYVFSNGVENWIGFGTTSVIERTNSLAAKQPSSVFVILLTETEWRDTSASLRFRNNTYLHIFSDVPKPKKAKPKKSNVRETWHHPSGNMISRSSEISGQIEEVINHYKKHQSV